MKLLNRIKSWFDDTGYNNSIIEANIDKYIQTVSIVDRCVELLINSTAQIAYKTTVQENGIYKTVNHPFNKLLNKPSTDIDRYRFFKHIAKELVFKGNCLIYNTRQELQIIPNFHVEKGNFVVTSYSTSKTLNKENCIYISLGNYEYDSGVPIISRISDELTILTYIYKYLNNFFKNNSFLGVIFKTERTLSKKLKEKYTEDFQNTIALLRSKAYKPIIIDSGINIEKLNNSIKDSDVSEILATIQSQIIKSLGIPEILINAGNNANISQNIRLFYYLTILPIAETIASAFTLHVQTLYPQKAVIVKTDSTNVPALRKDLEEISASLRNLYSVGIITKNEARKAMGYEQVTDGDDFLEPLNITGRAPKVQED